MRAKIASAGSPIGSLRDDVKGMGKAPDRVPGSSPYRDDGEGGPYRDDVEGGIPLSQDANSPALRPRPSLTFDYCLTTV
ncbi:MAG: hypothetical protein U2P59_09430 [Synergistota bacterium]|nr:hypothetical protein [Synergistota bacterium]